MSRYWLYDEETQSIEEIVDAHEHEECENEEDLHMSVVSTESIADSFEIKRIDWVFDKNLQTLVCMLMSDGEQRWQLGLPDEVDRETIENVVACLIAYDDIDDEDESDETESWLEGNSYNE